MLLPELIFARAAVDDDLGTPSSTVTDLLSLSVVNCGGVEVDQAVANGDGLLAAAVLPNDGEEPNDTGRTAAGEAVAEKENGVKAPRWSLTTAPRR